VPGNRDAVSDYSGFNDATLKAMTAAYGGPLIAASQLAKIARPNDRSDGGSVFG
jgi:hypothetical protein